MRVPRPGLALAAAALIVSAGLTVETIAQRTTQAAVEQWVDGLLTEIRNAGATEAKRGAVSYNAQTGALSIADVVITTSAPGNPQVSIARVSGTNVQAGARFQAANLRLEGIVARTTGEANMRIGLERMVIENIDMPSIGPAAAAGGRGPGLAAALRDLNAAKITIPAIAVRGTSRNSQTDMTLSGFTFERISRGVASRLTTGEQSLSIREPGVGPVRVSVSEGEGEAVDIAMLVEFFAPTPGAPRERRLAYGKYQVGGMTLEVPDAGTSVEIGEVNIANVFFTPPRVGYLTLMNLSQQIVDGGNTPNPAVMRDFARMMEDYIDAVTVESVRVDSFSVTSGDIVLATGEIVGRELGGSRYGRLSVKDIEFEGALEGKIEGITLTDLDFSPMMKALFEAMAQGNATPDPRAFEGRLPRLAALEITGVSVENPGTDAITMNRLAFEMGQWRGFIPDRLTLALRALKIPEALLPTQPPRPRDLGYTHFDVSSDIRMALDDAARKITLTPGRIALTGMGAFEAEVTLAGIDSRQFGYEGLSNPGPILEAAQVERVRLRIENAGLLERMSDWYARQQNIPAATLRQSMIMSLAPMLPMLVQDPANQQQAQQALQAFSQTPRALTFVITPRPGQPLTLAEVIALTQGNGPPLQLLTRVAVVVTAND